MKRAVDDSWGKFIAQEYHCHSRFAPEPSKVLVVISPARFVRFFEEIHALGQPTPEQFKELERKYEVLHFLPSSSED